VSACAQKISGFQVLTYLTMSKLKMNWHVPNKNTDLLKKISLMETVLLMHFCKEYENKQVTHVVSVSTNSLNSLKTDWINFGKIIN